ncbi:DUF5060 domain-containing protein [Algoriphagus lutimaris]|uniref:Kelch repeat-containing protein n=1 Tax=Algoriphagus lutimaris TaxID=613197 RepID=UPI00196A603A|nr:DUF5060 domain-containing protein [Algoriphagus lutimaris]MBN3521036.1 DUF5060 domain-containing protein [Algoriphagus lutimaris]
MKYIFRAFLFFPLLSMLLLQSCDDATPSNWHWETVQTVGEPTARHEAGLIAYKDKLYLMGGRRINPTSVFDPATNTWTEKSATPIELHHFQPVVYKDAIYLVGAMTGEWPNETPVDRIIKYYPERDEYVYGDSIPKHRSRGGAGAVVYNNKIYLIGGITNGHMNGYKPWLDAYNPENGVWETLADAPNARDHFQAVVLDDKLYAFAGRTTSKITDQDMALTVSHGNIYNFTTNKWETVTNNLEIPTMRAGNFAFRWNNSIIIGGGETAEQVDAHNEVEAFNTKTNLWSKWPSLNQGRHGTGFAVIGNYVYVASGSGKHGGEPELTTIERLELPQGDAEPISENVDSTTIHMQWHPLTLSFKGPESSELAQENPFLNYRLSVDFKNEETQYTIRGFYAADGNASETSSEAGSIWRVHFNPDKTGTWSYSAKLIKGDSIALNDDPTSGETVFISNAKGNFKVIKSDKEGDDFRAHGRIEAYNGYFKFTGTDNYWIKAGTNSPENLLAYIDFDDTYRIKAEAREGEAATSGEIHSYEPHLKDWNTGDPTWKGGKGKSLIGSINYLASKGMNVAYFLTLNILGDGKDVWPYVSPDDFTRFDVSKLDQWEILFKHMQSKGILLHVVIQETENETMLDGGDTGPLRQLYLHELIARFGHHNALIWNLGEENGLAPWVTTGAQTDAQRKSTATFIKKNDPYNHPVVNHTLPTEELRATVLDSLLGFPYVDGISLQHHERKSAPEVVQGLKEISINSGHEWLVTMDEIGMWYDGAMTDTEDPNHSTLRRYALWGTLLSGGAGVEWYFGAQHPHTDLTSEDWRQRNRLWEITNYAKAFFNTYLPYWEMQPEHSLINSKEAYCLRKKDEVYAIYLPNSKTYTIDLSSANGSFTVQWFNPLMGGELQIGSVHKIEGGRIRSLGNPPKIENMVPDQDWVVLIKRSL